MTANCLDALTEEPVLYLTTLGRSSGVPRTIEIWFTYHAGKLYLNAERGRSAQWVQNILHHAQVSVRLGVCEFVGQARVLTALADEALWHTVAELSRGKYGWGEGLPVEITPL